MFSLAQVCTRQRRRPNHRHSRNSLLGTPQRLKWWSLPMTRESYSLLGSVHSHHLDSQLILSSCTTFDSFRNTFLPGFLKLRFTNNFYKSSASSTVEAQQSLHNQAFSCILRAIIISSKSLTNYEQWRCQSPLQGQRGKSGTSTHIYGNWMCQVHSSPQTPQRISFHHHQHQRYPLCIGQGVQQAALPSVNYSLEHSPGPQKRTMRSETAKNDSSAYSKHSHTLHAQRVFKKETTSCLASGNNNSFRLWQ